MDSQHKPLTKAQFTHKYLIPIGYTLICGLSIFCAKDIFDTEKFKQLHLNNSELFEIAFPIYVIILLESVLGILDKALKKVDAQFNIKLLYYLCFIILNIGFTFWLTLKYVLGNSGGAVSFIIALMLLMKLVTTFFINNTCVFMVDYYVETRQAPEIKP